MGFSSGSTTTGHVLRGFIDGLTMTFFSSTSLAVLTGEASDSTSSAYLELPSSMTKTAAPWTAGAGGGGLDTGAMLATAGTYHWYIIGNASATVTDIIFSQSSSAPTLPTGFTLYRLIMSVLWTGTAWVGFSQEQDTILYTNVQTGDTKTMVVNTSQLFLPGVPTGLKVVALCNVGMNSTPGGSAYWSSPDQADEIASGVNPLRATNVAVGGQFSGFGTAEQIRTNTSGQVRGTANTASSVIRISARGYIHPRGRNL
jgi:hypothetical protein